LTVAEERKARHLGCTFDVAVNHTHPNVNSSTLTATIAMFGATRTASSTNGRSGPFAVERSSAACQDQIRTRPRGSRRSV